MNEKIRNRVMNVGAQIGVPTQDVLTVKFVGIFQIESKFADPISGHD